MKQFFVVLFIFQTFSSFSQTSVQVEYRGGTNALTKLFSKSISDRSSNTENLDVRSNRFYSVEFSLDPKGHIMDNFVIVSTSTIDIDSTIVLFMKKVEGNWINHSGKSIAVVLPISFLYKDSSVRLSNTQCTLTTTSFSKWNKKEIQVLEPLIITIQPTMH
jgi:hypothetical protein